jgi:hypothetical protein
LQELPFEEQGPILVIDESLSDRPLAQALRLVSYNTAAATEQFGHGARDPIIIQWLGLQRGIWVTADEKAKRKHAQEIRDAGIHIVWVRRPKWGMSKKAQLLLLLWVVDPILQETARAKGPAQFLAYYSGERPKWKRLN